MGKLTNILAQSDGGGNFVQAWDVTTAASDFGPLPPGDYVAGIESGELVNVGQKQTPAYKLKFRVAEGDYLDRLFWHDLWLTEAALPQAKRDLAKLGVTEPSQLEQPLPPGIIVRARLALRSGDDGSQYNRVVKFEVLRIEKPEQDPFAPKSEGANDVEG